MKRLITTLLIAGACIPIAFADTETLECDYNMFSSSDGHHKVKDEFKLTFIIDMEKGAVYMLGNQGSTEVQLMSSAGGITFLEITNSGNVMITTMDEAGSSVHSRHTIIFGELVPTQYYGNCVFK